KREDKTLCTATTAQYSWSTSRRGTSPGTRCPKRCCGSSLAGLAWAPICCISIARRGASPSLPPIPPSFLPAPRWAGAPPPPSKFAVLPQAPLPGCIGDPLSPSFMATELKRAGCDALIIMGKSPEPCLVFLHDGQVEFLDATSYWGLSTAATEHAVQIALGRR